MKKLAIFLVASLMLKAAAAQSASEVITAEKAFAAYALSHNTKEAFLQFTDDSGLIFNGGNASNAKKVFSGSPGSPNKLLWSPAFAGAARSGNLAFTTGPWTAKKTLTDTALAAGNFTTVWHKTAAGSWAFLVDMGISYTGAEEFPATVKEATASTPDVAHTDALQIEQTFIADYNRQDTAAYAHYILPQSWFTVQGLHPFKSAAEIMAHYSVLSGISFSPTAGGISSTYDLAYCYGVATRQGAKENYLHIWQHTPQGWKLIIQVLKLGAEGQP